MTQQDRQDEVDRIQRDYRVKVMWGIAKVAFGIAITVMGNMSVSYLREIVDTISVTAASEQADRTHIQQLIDNMKIQGDAIKALTVRQDRTDQILDDAHLRHHGQDQ